MPTSQILLATTKSSAALTPFNLTLDSSDNSRLGDTTTVQNNWWATQTYDPGFVTNIGQQSYQGYYAFTAGKAASLTATLGGASGWGNGRGRSITATFSIAVGDRIVFFAGKPGSNTGTTGWADAGSGGASCLMKYSTSLSSDADYENGFVPLIIAAGGGSLSVGYMAAAPSQFPQGLQELCVAAPPLSVTTGNTSSQIMAVRNNFSSASLVAKGGGAGRNTYNTGGCGWIGPSKDESNGAVTPNAVGLAYGALGNEQNGTDHGPGGFGGGGRNHNNNSYQPGAGGYYGGCETRGSEGQFNHTEYSVWQVSPTEDHRYGALSFVHSSGSNVTDNGLYGTGTLGANQNSQINKGRVYLSFTAV